MQLSIKGDSERIAWSDKEFQAFRLKLLILTARRERQSDPIYCFLEKCKGFQCYSPARKPIDKVLFFTQKEARGIRARLRSFLKICKGDTTRGNLLQLVAFLTRAINKRRRVYIYENNVAILGRTA